jgi:putative redox protein
VSPTPAEVELLWKGGLIFEGRSSTGSAMILDSAGLAGPSPVHALAFALAGCMAMDVASILEKGRLDLKGLRAKLHGERAAEDPMRLVKVDLKFTVEGDVPAEKIERAIALSRDKYCSVWHSLRQDIDFTTSFDVVKAPAAR